MATSGEQICLVFLHIIGYPAASRSPLCGSALFLGYNARSRLKQCEKVGADGRWEHEAAATTASRYHISVAEQDEDKRRDFVILMPDQL